MAPTKFQFCFIAVALSAAVSAVKVKDDTNPIQKVLELLTSLEGKIIAHGSNEKQAYDQYTLWCSETSTTKANDIATGEEQHDLLETTVAKAQSDGEDATVKIAALIKEISIDEQKLKATAAMRASERKDFEASVKELTTAIEMMTKASDVLAKQVAPDGSSLLQASGSSNSDLQEALMGLGTVIDAIGLADENDSRLTSLLEAAEEASEDDALGRKVAPKKSASIIGVLEDMKAKAEDKVDKLRTAEFHSQHNYDALKMALDHKVKTAKSDLAAQKTISANAAETKAKASGDLAIVTKDLQAAKEALKSVQQDCIQKAADHEVSLRGREVELKALTEAKKMIRATTGAAEARTYGDKSLPQDTEGDDDSFLQVSALSTLQAKARSEMMRRGRKALDLVRKLAKEQKSEELSQLSSRILAVYKLSSLGGNVEDPFVKVKSLIKNLIDKLTKEAYAEATEKKYCDSELKHTRGKRGDLKTDVDALKMEIEKAVTSSTTLKGQVKELQAELAEIADLQGKSDNVRKMTKAAYLEAKQDLNDGLSGIRTALKILRDYYSSKSSLIQTREADAAASDDAGAESAISFVQMKTKESEGEGESFEAFMEESEDAGHHESEGAGQPAPPENHSKAAGAGAGIINVLEVIESDMAKNLAEETTEEETAQAEYEKETQNNKVLTAAKDRDVKWKTQEFQSLDQNVADLKTDFNTHSEQLAAVLQYLEKVKDKCIAQPIPFEERAKRRAAEIKGLESALVTLTGQASFLQP